MPKIINHKFSIFCYNYTKKGLIIEKIKLNINYYINLLAIIFAFSIGLVKFLAPISGGIMILLWLIEGNFQKKLQIITQYKSFLLFLIFIIYLFLTLFISNNINYTLPHRNFWVSWTENPYEYFIRHYLFYTFILIVLITSIQKKFIKYIINALIFGMLINEITSYLVFFKIIPPIHHTKEIVPFFINHSYYSFFLVITIFLMIIEIAKLNNNYIKYIYFIFISTASINLILNTGRIGQISFFIILIIAIIYFNRNLKKTLFLLLSLPILFIIFYNFSKPFKNRMNQTKISIEKIIHQHNLHSSIGQRIAMDIIGIEISKKYPLFGVGIDEAMNAKAKIIDEDFPLYKFIKKYIQFHNQYIQYLVEGGIIGLLLFIIFIILVFLEKTNDIGKDIKYLIFPIFLLTFLTETPLLRDRSFALFILIYSIILIYSKERKNLTP